MLPKPDPEDRTLALPTLFEAWTNGTVDLATCKIDAAITYKRLSCGGRVMRHLFECKFSFSVAVLAESMLAATVNCSAITAISAP